MKKYVFDNIEYELIENYKDGFSKDDVELKYTDYFNEYDYILGDWAYGKLRLKGFCNKENKNYNNTNDFSNYKKYLKEYCAYECKYFILRRLLSDEKSN